MITKIVAAAAMAAGLLASAPSANAEDHRPCVSREEYRQTHDVSKFNMRGAISRPPTRRELERRWEVRHLGVIDPEMTDARSTFWMYPVCGYRFEDAQVWASVVNKTQRVGVISLWVRAGAIPNGSIY